MDEPEASEARHSTNHPSTVVDGAIARIQELLTQRELRRARMMEGLPTPSTQLPAHKLPFKRLSSRHRAVISLHLQGVGNEEIAAQVGFSRAYISIILNNPRTEGILNDAYRLYDKELKALYPKSIGVLRKALDSEDSKVAMRAVELTLKANGKLKDAIEGQAATAEDVVRRLIEIRTEGPATITMAEEAIHAT